jgi:hypothetical protein
MQGEEAVCEKEPLKIASQVEDRGGRHSETEAHLIVSRKLGIKR